MDFDLDQLPANQLHDRAHGCASTGVKPWRRRHIGEEVSRAELDRILDEFDASDGIFNTLEGDLEDMAAEILALRALIENAQVVESPFTEYYCPSEGRWVTCPGEGDCVHDESRKSPGYALQWTASTRLEMEALHRATQPAPQTRP